MVCLIECLQPVTKTRISKSSPLRSLLEFSHNFSLLKIKMRPEFSLFVYRKSTVNVEHILQFLKRLALCDSGLWMTLCFKSKINKRKKGTSSPSLYKRTTTDSASRNEIIQQGHLYYLRLLFCLLFETVMIIHSVVLCVLITLAINVFISCFFFTKRKEKKKPTPLCNQNVTPEIFSSKLKAFKQIIVLLCTERGLSISIIGRQGNREAL